MESMVYSVYEEIATHDQKDTFDLSISSLPQCYGDSVLIKKVWSNLLSNALKYTMPKDERIIEVGNYSENGKNVYYVKDNGVGFNAKYAEKLFGIFQRLHRTDEFEGTGVGLAIVQQIIHRHGGEVWAEGKINKGSKFYFSMPERWVLMEEDDEIEILLVEDNPYDAELALRAFKKNNIYNPIKVLDDGEEALDFIFCRGEYNERGMCKKIKVILLDLKLPKINGLEVLKAIKTDPVTKKIPVVMLTSSKEESDIVESYNLGANSYIVKPVDFNKFVEAVRDLGLYWLLLNQV